MDTSQLESLVSGKLKDAGEGSRRDVLLRMARLCGGYAAGGLADDAHWQRYLEGVCKDLGWPNPNKISGHIRDGIAYGRAQPLTSDASTASTATPQTERVRHYHGERLVILSSQPLKAVKNRKESVTNRFPLTMSIPPDRAALPGLALPNGQWQRQPDGGIVVTFQNAGELEACLWATKAARSG